MVCEFPCLGIAWPELHRVHFRMIGAAKDDPGLEFQRDQSGKSAEENKGP